MIIVTGANGQLGRQIVNRLLTRLPADQVGVSVRDPGKARALADRGVRVRQGDFTDAASLAHAVAGASQVLLVSVDKMGEDAVKQHQAAIDGAVAAGARRILYTSQMGASASSRFQACRDHAVTEEALRACGVPFTALRNGFHAASAAARPRAGGAVGRHRASRDGPVCWTAHADLAEGSRRDPWPTRRAALTAPRRHSPRPGRSTSPASPASSARSPAGPSPGPPSPTTSSAGS